MNESKICQDCEKFCRGGAGAAPPMNNHMDREISQIATPPVDVDVDEGLDAYDEELTETFPASDVPASAHP